MRNMALSNFNSFNSVASILAVAFGFAASPLAAQAVEAPAPDRPVAASEKTTDNEEIVVTGSYIARPVQDSPTPLSLVGAAEISRRGILTTDQLLKTLPSNGVSRSVTDTVGSPYIAGTAQLNLRGFGLSSTLTLINGRREVVAPVPDIDGASFVDINVIPLVMIERLEVLQGGAAALYGSDAIAGVGNFIMRTRYDGVELRGGGNMTSRSDYSEYTVSGLFGHQGERFHFVAGAEYLERTSLGFKDRPFSRGQAISATGQPGSFRAVTAPTVSLMDPNCAAAGGIPRPTNPANPAVGVCAIDLTNNFDIIPPEKRINGYATTDFELTPDLTLFAEGGLSRGKITEITSPSYAVLTNPVVPANNPGNLVANGGFGVPVLFFGRPFGPRYRESTTQYFRLHAYRGVVGLKGAIADDWKFNTSYAYSSESSRFDENNEVNSARFAAALNCQGGPSNNLCFNPFGSAYLNPALANSQAVINDFSRASFRYYRATMQSLDGVVTGKLFALPGGDVTLAVGGQYRHETLSFDSDIEQQTGQLAYLFSGPAFKVGRNVVAGFGELDLPVVKSVDIQLAGRYEHYDAGIGGKFTPKAAIRFKPIDAITLRGSVGKSFRAPSLSQISTLSNSQTALADPLNPSPVPYFSIIRTTVASNLSPENSTNYNIGAVVTPLPGLSISADYFNYKYTNLIAKQDAQSIVNANPLDPRIKRSTANGPIQFVDISFVNQRSVLADGIDFALDYNTNITDRLHGSFTTRATWLSRYVADVGIGPENLVGLRNYQNFADPLPRWRASGVATLDYGPHSLTATVNYIDSVKENLNNRTAPQNGFLIKSFTTFDLQFTENIGENYTLSVGVQNLFDRYPPAVALTNIELSGYERQLHDARGRIFSARARVKF